MKPEKINELRQWLKNNIMIRRTRADVKHQLPRSLRVIETVVMNTEKEVNVIDKMENLTSQIGFFTR